MPGVGLGTGLLHVRDGMQVPKDRTPDNSELWLIALESKSLTSTETHYRNIEREALAYSIV